MDRRDYGSIKGGRLDPPPRQTCSGLLPNSRRPVVILGRWDEGDNPINLILNSNFRNVGV